LSTLKGNPALGVLSRPAHQRLTPAVGLLAKFSQQVIMRIQFIVFPAFVLAAIFGCRLFSPEYENNKTTFEKTYSIDTETTLTSLASGNLDIFTSDNVTPIPFSSTSTSHITWTQSDYFLVAHTLHNFVWNESLDGWKLQSMFFRVHCDDIARGFPSESGGFRFFKVLNTPNENSRLVRDIFLDPSVEQASVVEILYRPELTQWTSLDLSKIRITAEQVLKIVETKYSHFIKKDEKGGSCIILARLDTNLKYNGWLVQQLTSDTNDSFPNIVINPETGESQTVP